MQDGLRNEFPYGKCQTVSAKLRIMNLKKVLDKMPQYLFLLKLAFSCQICALHLILVLLQAKTKFILVLELEQCCCPKQKNQSGCNDKIHCYRRSYGEYPYGLQFS